LMTFTDQIAVITLSTSISNAANAMLYGITLSIAYNHLHKKELVDENKETLKAHNINVRKPLVTSKTYKVVTGQANELHQSHKRSIFERAINRILRRKKI
ncbi:MAG: hypothetical protein NUK65_13760, partial [Firmicutes bacterium]|nr:hypothetical protein [Bacillota bacterium]